VLVVVGTFQILDIIEGDGEGGPMGKTVDDIAILEEERDYIINGASPKTLLIDGSVDINTLSVHIFFSDTLGS
jgi:hypothetical protein